MSSIPQGAGLDLGYAADNMETLPYEPEGIQAESLGTIEMRMGSVTRNINISGCACFQDSPERSSSAKDDPASNAAVASVAAGADGSQEELEPTQRDPSLDLLDEQAHWEKLNQPKITFTDVQPESC